MNTAWVIFTTIRLLSVDTIGKKKATVNEPIEKLKKYDNPDREVYIERDWDIDDINIGSGNAVSIESHDLETYIAATVQNYIAYAGTPSENNLRSNLLEN